MAEGKLPNFARLKDQGGYRRLRSACWSTFATAVDPEMREREPFWNILGRHGVESTILRVPGTLPMDGFEGRLLSAAPAQGGFSHFFTKRPVSTASFKGGKPYPLIEADGALAGVLSPASAIPFCSASSTRKAIPFSTYRTGHTNSGGTNTLRGSGSNLAACMASSDFCSLRAGGRFFNLRNSCADRSREPCDSHQPAALLCDLPRETARSFFDGEYG